MHCEDPGCLKACPAPGAIVQYANGIVDFISENCIGCGYCVKGCPFNIPRVSKVDRKSYKCTLCSDRVTVGREPACVKACPTGRDHVRLQERHDGLGGRARHRPQVARLRECGLYDPPGVGGTHVMYVLHHADRPSLYAGLPNNPKISVLRRGVEGRDEAARARRHRVRRARGLPPLDRRGVERSRAARRGRSGRSHREVGKHDFRRPLMSYPGELSSATPQRRGSTTGSRPHASCC